MSFDERGRCPRRYTGVVQCEDEVRIHARKMSENLFSNENLLDFRHAKPSQTTRLPLGISWHPHEKIRTTDLSFDYADC